MVHVHVHLDKYSNEKYIIEYFLKITTYSDFNILNVNRSALTVKTED